jgi:hypothetical protein
MKGQMIIPLKWSDTDATMAVINTDGIVGKTFNGIRIDHVARVGDHFEAAYTVVSEELAKRLMASPVITCSTEARR